jgi:hypothetical protein
MVVLAHVALHIALTGDYVWSALTPEPGFRPLRDVRAAFLSKMPVMAAITMPQKNCESSSDGRPLSKSHKPYLW